MIMMLFQENGMTIIAWSPMTIGTVCRESCAEEFFFFQRNFSFEEEEEAFPPPLQRKDFNKNKEGSDETILQWYNKK